MGRQLRSLGGQVVAITGGGRGIGRATAAALIAKGARVAIGDIDAPLSERTASELGSGTIGLPLDVTDKASFTSFLDEVESRLGPLDVLVNNAGIMPVGPFVDESDAATEKLVDINIMGVIIGSKLALQRFRPRGRGHIVQLASIAGKGGFPGGATYCATKHAVVGLTEALRSELRGTGIEVHQVLPIGVNTELYSGVSQARGFKTPEPEDVAGAIVELLADRQVRDLCPAADRGRRAHAGADAAPDHRGGRPDHQGRPGAAERRPERPRGLRRAHGPDVRRPGGPGCRARPREGRRLRAQRRRTARRGRIPLRRPA